MRSFVLAVLFGVLFQGSLFANEFDFKDQKGVNAIMFSLDSPLEPFGGLGSGVSGKVSFDGTNGKSLKGEILLAVDSIKMANDDMSKHLKGEMWLDAAKFPNIKVELKEVIESTNKSENEFNLKVKCNVEIKGISKEMELNITAVYHKDKLEERVPKLKGDLLVLKTTFTVKRDDFKIKAGEFLSKVGNEIVITGNITGSFVK